MSDGAHAFTLPSTEPNIPFWDYETASDPSPAGYISYNGHDNGDAEQPGAAP